MGDAVAETVDSINLLDEMNRLDRQVRKALRQSLAPEQLATRVPAGQEEAPGAN